MDHLLTLIAPQPGIQRDRTTYSSPFCIDGQWCRFYEKGDAKKIGGFLQIEQGTPKIVRGMYVVPQQNSVDVYLGRSATLNVLSITTSGIPSVEYDRTPVNFDADNFVVNLAFNSVQTTNLSHVVQVTVPSIAGLFNGEELTFNFVFSGANVGGITAAQLNITAPITIVNGTTISYVTAGTGNGGSGGGFGSYSYPLGTNLWTFDLYPLQGQTLANPIAISTNDPIYTQNGSGVVFVYTTTPPLGLVKGIQVTIAGAAAVATITAPELNITAVVLEVGPDYFIYETNGTANATTNGGGNAVTYNYTYSSTFLIAHAAPNANDINSNVETQIWWGDVSLTTPFIPIVTPPGDNQTCSGGIVVLYPYIFKYGNDGVVAWTKEPTTWGDIQVAVITGQKIIKGLRTRGGSSSPSGLFWSLNALIRCTFIGGNGLVFQFDTIQDDISVMGQNSIVTYNNIFFWIGLDQFYIYNGVVQRLENDMSADYFFNNINIGYRNKVWGMVLPRFHEIWWFYPRGLNTECSDVIIFNYQLQTWYDSILARSAGYPPNFYPYPLMADANLTSDVRNVATPSYSIWQHEFGTDMIINNQSLAIDSYYTTNVMTYFDNDPATDREMRIRRIEPDFVQTGTMTLSILSRDFAAGPVTSSQIYPFDANTNIVNLSKVDTTNMGRLNSFTFRSNVSGGSYQAGKILLNYDKGDVYP